MKKQIITYILVFVFSAICHYLPAQNLEVYKTPYFNPQLSAKSYCNPMNIAYSFEYYNEKSIDSGFRTTADPVIVYYKNDYYLFSTNQSGYFWSHDLGSWHYVYAGFQRFPNQNDQCAPAAWIMNDTLFYAGSTYTSLPIWFTTRPKSGRWQHYVDSTLLPAWDPGYFYDDDQRLYLYYGSSGTRPVKGVEVDKKTFLPKGNQTDYQTIYTVQDIDAKQEATGEIKELIWLKPDANGWERFGENNDHPNAPWGHFIEGAWMNKHNEKYYLQYSAPGTEFKVYADGVYTSENPLGPFLYQKHNPFAYKPGGFITGCGHGNTFADAYGNYWHTATARISVKYKFERRIGLYPAGFDNAGTLYTITSFGDYPTWLPNGKTNHLENQHTGWMLLSYKKETTASSTEGSYLANNATDEDIRTYWSALTEKQGEWLQIDLGEVMEAHAFQVNYADHKTQQHGKAMDLYHQYKIYGSNNESDWVLVVDKSWNDMDIPHDYVELSHQAKFRYFKIENLHMATGLFAISDFRVFGKANKKPPSIVKNFKAERDKSDPRRAFMHWSATTNAYGYNIYFGVEPNKLYNCITINGKTSYDFRGMSTGNSYYFAIEAMNEGGISQRTRLLKVK